MAELITAIARYAPWLYVVLGLLMVREVVTMWRAGHEHDLSLFSLEREAATGRAVRSLVTLFLLATIGVGVYAVTNVIAPTLSERELRQARGDVPIVETPLVAVLASDTPEPVATPTRRPVRIVTAPPDPSEAVPAAPTAELCRNPDVQILSPLPGTVIDRPTAIVVTARFPVGSGRTFWLEIGAGAAPEHWAAVGARRDAPVEAATVETLRPAPLDPGLYSLRLVVTDVDGLVPENGTCALTVRVSP
jgi:hypothetical protein